MVVVGLGIDIITRNASGCGRLETVDGADVRRVGGLGDLLQEVVERQQELVSLSKGREKKKENKKRKKEPVDVSQKLYWKQELPKGKSKDTRSTWQAGGNGGMDAR